MPSTKDKKDKQNESGTTQQEGQTSDDWRKENQKKEGEGTPRDKSREQTAGTGRKME